MTLRLQLQKPRPCFLLEVSGLSLKSSKYLAKLTPLLPLWDGDNPETRPCVGPEMDGAGGAAALCVSSGDSCDFCTPSMSGSTTPRMCSQSLGGKEADKSIQGTEGLLLPLSRAGSQEPGLLPLLLAGG